MPRIICTEHIVVITDITSLHDTSLAHQLQGRQHTKNKLKPADKKAVYTSQRPAITSSQQSLFCQITIFNSAAIAANRKKKCSTKPATPAFLLAKIRWMLICLGHPPMWVWLWGPLTTLPSTAPAISVQPRATGTQGKWAPSPRLHLSPCLHQLLTQL